MHCWRRAKIGLSSAAAAIAYTSAMRTAVSKWPNSVDAPSRTAARIALASCRFGVDTPSPRPRSGQRRLDHVDIAGSAACVKTAPLMIQVANAARTTPVTTAAVSDPNNGVRECGGARWYPRCALCAAGSGGRTPTRANHRKSHDRRHHPDARPSRNRQGGSLGHRTESEGPEDRPPRCHRGGEDGHRRHHAGVLRISRGRRRAGCARGFGALLAGRRGWDG